MQVGAEHPGIVWPSARCYLQKCLKGCSSKKPSTGNMKPWSVLHRQCGDSVWIKVRHHSLSSLPLKKWVCSSQLQTPDFLMTYWTGLVLPPGCLYQARNLSLDEQNYKEKDWEEKWNQRNIVREELLLSQYYFLAWKRFTILMSFAFVYFKLHCKFMFSLKIIVLQSTAAPQARWMKFLF